MSQCRSLLWLFVSCFLSTFASAGSERLTAAYPPWPPYKVVQNGTIGGIDALVLDEIARRTGLEFDYVECPWARPHHGAERQRRYDHEYRADRRAQREHGLS